MILRTSNLWPYKVANIRHGISRWITVKILQKKVNKKLSKRYFKKKVKKII